MRLFLVRHGETSWNREGRNQGQNPTSLNKNGLQQAQSLAEAMGGLRVTAIYSSPLNRATQTAETIGGALGLPVIPKKGLMEMNLGSVDGLTSDEMQRDFPELVDQWRKDPSGAQMPRGETLEDVQTRAWQAIEDIRREIPEGCAIAVTHNFVIGVIVLRTLGLPLSAFQRIRVQLGSISALEHTRGRWTLLSLNETLHLRRA